MPQVNIANHTILSSLGTLPDSVSSPPKVGTLVVFASVAFSKPPLAFPSVFYYVDIVELEHDGL